MKFKKLLAGFLASAMTLSAGVLPNFTPTIQTEMTASAEDEKGIRIDDVTVEYGTTRVELDVYMVNVECHGGEMTFKGEGPLYVVKASGTSASSLDVDGLATVYSSNGYNTDESFTTLTVEIGYKAAPGVYHIYADIDKLDDDGSNGGFVENPVVYGGSVTIEAPLNYEYIIHDDYVEITGCDEYAVSVDIPDKIKGLPVTSIGDKAFSHCESLESVTIPNSVTSIGEYAFGWCTSLESVTIRNGVTSIGNSAFYGCTSLESITIPESVTNIGEYAFGWCTSLESVTIGNGVTSIGNSAFSGCTSLESITIPESVTNIGGYAFDDTPWLESMQNNNPLVIVNSILINGKKCSGSVIIPDGVKSIGEYSFNWCNDIESVTIPDSVVSIGESAFWDCSNLLEIEIPKTIKDFGALAFDGTPWLEKKQAENQYVILNNVLIDATKCDNIVIPDNITKIGGGAFFHTYIEDIVIPEYIESIGDMAFGYCSHLKKITILNPDCEIYDDSSTICSYAEKGEHDRVYNGVIYGEKDSTAQAYAENWGYKFKLIGSEEDEPATIRGDISGNGEIDLYDVIEIAKFLIHKVDFTEEQKKIADFNEDDVVDLYDAIDIAKYILEHREK